MLFQKSSAKCCCKLEKESLLSLSLLVIFHCFQSRPQKVGRSAYCPNELQFVASGIWDLPPSAELEGMIARSGSYSRSRRQRHSGLSVKLLRGAEWRTFPHRKKRSPALRKTCRKKGLSKTRNHVIVPTIAKGSFCTLFPAHVPGSYNGLWQSGDAHGSQPFPDARGGERGEL